MPVNGQILDFQPPLLFGELFQHAKQLLPILQVLFFFIAGGNAVSGLQVDHLFEQRLTVFAQSAAQKRLFGGQQIHMVSNQGHHFLPQCGRRFQPQQDLLCHTGAFSGVTVEMSLTLFVLCKGLGLGNVVQQCRPAQRGVCRQVAQHLFRVPQYIITMVAAVLAEIHTGSKLRQNLQ